MVTIAEWLDSQFQRGTAHGEDPTPLDIANAALRTGFCGFCQDDDCWCDGHGNCQTCRRDLRECICGME